MVQATSPFASVFVGFRFPPAPSGLIDTIRAAANAIARAMPFNRPHPVPCWRETESYIDRDGRLSSVELPNRPDDLRFLRCVWYGPGAWADKGNIRRPQHGRIGAIPYVLTTG